MTKLTEKNYFSPEMNRKYMSVSQYKAFCKCEAAALAELNGTYEKPKSRALTLGSYVDEMLTGTAKSQEKFITENYAELFKKNGEPYADVAKANDAAYPLISQIYLYFIYGSVRQTF